MNFLRFTVVCSLSYSDFLCVSLCTYFSEKYKQDYEKLEELLKTLPNRTTHEVMVRFISCWRSLVHSPSSFGPLFLFFLLFQCWCSVYGHLDHLLWDLLAGLDQDFCPWKSFPSDLNNQSSSQCNVVVNHIYYP